TRDMLAPAASRLDATSSRETLWNQTRFSKGRLFWSRSVTERPRRRGAPRTRRTLASARTPRTFCACTTFSNFERRTHEGHMWSAHMWDILPTLHDTDMTVSMSGGPAPFRKVGWPVIRAGASHSFTERS